MDVSTWSHKDLEGIDLKVASHRLNVDPRYKSVHQKLRNVSTERRQAMENEVDKLLANGSIREVAYPD